MPDIPEIPEAACRCPAAPNPCWHPATQDDQLCDWCRESPRCARARNPIWDALREARDEGRLLGVDKETGRIAPFPPGDDRG